MYKWANKLLRESFFKEDQTHIFNPSLRDFTDTSILYHLEALALMYSLFHVNFPFTKNDMG